MLRPSSILSLCALDPLSVLACAAGLTSPNQGVRTQHAEMRIDQHALLSWLICAETTIALYPMTDAWWPNDRNASSFRGAVLVFGAWSPISISDSRLSGLHLDQGNDD